MPAGQTGCAPRPLRARSCVQKSRTGSPPCASAWEQIQNRAPRCSYDLSKYCSKSCVFCASSDAVEPNMAEPPQRALLLLRARFTSAVTLCAASDGELLQRTNATRGGTVTQHWLSAAGASSAVFCVPW
eukprot:1982371-Prymnesium_polylepis.1